LSDGTRFELTDQGALCGPAVAFDATRATDPDGCTMALFAQKSKQHLGLA
jgi:hypothetical protein